MTWFELQEMPEDVLALWRAFASGEALGEQLLAERAKAPK